MRWRTPRVRRVKAGIRAAPVRRAIVAGPCVVQARRPRKGTRIPPRFRERRRSTRIPTAALRRSARMISAVSRSSTKPPPRFLREATIACTQGLCERAPGGRDLDVRKAIAQRARDQLPVPVVGRHHQRAAAARESLLEVLDPGEFDAREQRLGREPRVPGPFDDDAAHLGEVPAQERVELRIAPVGEDDPHVGARALAVAGREAPRRASRRAPRAGSPRARGARRPGPPRAGPGRLPAASAARLRSWRRARAACVRPRRSRPAGRDCAGSAGAPTATARDGAG